MPVIGFICADERMISGRRRAQMEWMEGGVMTAQGNSTLAG